MVGELEPSAVGIGSGFSCPEGWQYILSDESRRCFAAYLPCPLKETRRAARATGCSA